MKWDPGPDQDGGSATLAEKNLLDYKVLECDDTYTNMDSCLQESRWWRASSRLFQLITSPVPRYCSYVVVADCSTSK